jgi:hypothetical protein
MWVLFSLANIVSFCSCPIPYPDHMFSHSLLLSSSSYSSLLTLFPILGVHPLSQPSPFLTYSCLLYIVPPSSFLVPPHVPPPSSLLTTVFLSLFFSYPSCSSCVYIPHSSALLPSSSPYSSSLFSTSSPCSPSSLPSSFLCSSSFFPSSCLIFLRYRFPIVPFRVPQVLLAKFLIPLVSLI